MKLGSLCTGYGGLDLAVENVLGTQLAWTSDIDKGACAIIDHRFGHVPNIGDMTTVDWDDLEPVDVLTAGYPCQPFSHAGRRKGTDDVRHLWPYIRQAIRRIRPQLTILENVSGHRSLGFGRVLGDMAEDGLHVRWVSLRASDVGAPHGRDRVFLAVTRDPDFTVGGEWWEPASRQTEGRRPRPDIGGPSGEHLMPTPRASAGMNGPLRPHAADTSRLEDAVAVHLTVDSQTLLPTPTQRDYKDNVVRLEPHRPNDVDTLSRALTLLPSPRATDGTKGGPNQRGSSGDLMLPSAVQAFGRYHQAVDRWATILGRPAPAPTEPTGRGDAHRLSPAFVEWMMGLPAGWVTDVPDLTRNQQLKALGNGVVPQQAEAALRMLLTTAVPA